MGTLDRIGTIIKANINDMLDDIEEITGVKESARPDPEEALRVIKKETASVMASETLAKRKLEECEALIAKTKDKIQGARQSQDEEAIDALTQKLSKLEAQRRMLCENLEEISSCAKKMQDIYEKFKTEIPRLKREEQLERTREYIESFYQTKDAADKQEDLINAYASLIEKDYENNVKPAITANTYEEENVKSQVDKELEALKASLNLKGDEDHKEE